MLYVWPSNYCNYLSNSLSQIIIYLSSEPEIIYFSSKLNETEMTQPVCPSNYYTNIPVSLSHTFIVLSSEQETIYLPSLLNYTYETL